MKSGAPARPLYPHAPGLDDDERKRELSRIRGQLDPALARVAARYLLDGAWVQAWMGVEDDILEGRFRVPGGASEQTDGTYYWPHDAADYVLEYLIGLPDDFIAHCEANNWTVPPVSEERLEEIRDLFRAKEPNVEPDVE